MGLVGISVLGGQARPIVATATQLGQDRVEPGDAGEIVGGQPQLTVERPNDMTLTPPREAVRSVR